VVNILNAYEGSMESLRGVTLTGEVFSSDVEVFKAWLEGRASR
jgi:hypothetical protein